MSTPTPTRVLVDLSAMRPGGEGGGIKPFLLDQMRWLAAHAGNRMQFLHVADPDTVTVIQSLARTTDRVISRAEADNLTAARRSCDLVYCPFGLTDLACPGIPTVTLIVDLLHRDFPATLPEPDRIYREQKFATAVQVTDRFQVISDFTAARLHACYEVPSSRIFRTYPSSHGRLAFSNTDTKSVPLPAQGPYFLYPANFWIHKNHETLFLAYSIYLRQCGPSAWPLVLAGHLESPRLELIQDLLHSLDIQHHVRLTGYICDRSLAACYRAAGGLVFPSLHEGFGIPLIEAMAFDLPIIASQACSIPEITGDAALLVDANDPEALAAAMGRLTAEPELRSFLVHKGRLRLAAFSAQDHYQRLFDEMISTAEAPARWQRSGYHPADGLTDPVSVYALPEGNEEMTLVLRNRPLPVDRTLSISCGQKLLLERVLAANETIELSVSFLPLARNLVLHVPNASSLSATDPRTHGVLLDRFEVHTVDHRVHDLLSGIVASDSILPLPTKPKGDDLRRNAPSRMVWYLETAIPRFVPDGFLEVRGWCFGSSSQPMRLVLKAGGLRWSFLAAAPRPDVRAAHPEMETDACGFSVRVRLPAGDHQLMLEAEGDLARNSVLVMQPIRVPVWAGFNRWQRCRPARLLAFQLMLGPSQAPLAVRPEKFPSTQAPRSGWPRFSIVTPSYQQGRFLAETMRSVLGQDAAVDYVVQDGGSTDGSKTLIERFAGDGEGKTENGGKRQEAGTKQPDTGDGRRETGTGRAKAPDTNIQSPVSGPQPPARPRLLCWTSEPDSGQADAIAKGFAKTSGGADDLMAWLNSDDTYLPGTLAFVADYFARHPEVDVLYGNRVLVDEESREIGRWYLPRHDPEVLRLNDFVPQETLFWRRRIWERAGPIDPRFQFAMDWDLLLRFQAAGAHIVHVPHFLACFRVHSAQKTIATMQSIGQLEIDRLRTQSCGREVGQAEMENSPVLNRYLRRSAFIELASRVGLRLH